MSTGVARFDFQIAAVANARGRVLNIGANEDPAGLRERYGSKVINCDLQAWDDTMCRPNIVDKVFDMTEFPWPFDDDYAATSILGDVLEHMPKQVIIECLVEARRVSRELCITIPEDHRISPNAVEEWKRGEYNPHVTIATERLVREVLEASGWKPYIFMQAPWGFDNVNGWCIMAYRI